MPGMDVEPGMGMEPGMEPDGRPNLDEFLLARIAEDKRIATDAALATGQGAWRADGLPQASTEPPTAEHMARFDPDRVHAECAAKRRIVLACRDIRPDLKFLGARPPGMRDFPLSPHDQHQLAALTLALLAVPYAGHRDYREEWRP
jgi:hypothetical protein